VCETSAAIGGIHVSSTNRKARTVTETVAAVSGFAVCSEVDSQRPP
jgi:hypothetical protein